MIKRTVIEKLQKMRILLAEFTNETDLDIVRDPKKATEAIEKIHSIIQKEIDRLEREETKVKE